MGDELGTPFRKESLMRKVIALLVVALSCSSALNVYLLGRAGELWRQRGMYGEMLMGEGCARGKADAERDFAAGTPKWYRTTDSVGPVPPDKASRALIPLGFSLPCPESPYEEAYVKKYNQTMDVLCNTKVTRRTDSQASEEAAAEAGNE